MTDPDPAKSISRVTPPKQQVLQVERRDYLDLAPTGRPRSQSLRGFDPIYTDIVDYIVRCTHRIWDERDVGLIYSHYTHNPVVYGPLGAVYSREEIVQDTIARLAEMPDRRGMATQVIWRGDDVDGFYTSHLVTGTGRHTEWGGLGKPTGRRFVTRTVADCMVFENRIFREWVVRDNMGLYIQLGLDCDAFATASAKSMFDRGLTVSALAENQRGLGQTPPPDAADVSLAHTETEADVLRWLHEIYNRRMFGKIREVYASNCQWHGPRLQELYGTAAVTSQTIRQVAMIPDMLFLPQHICSVPCEEGGTKVAVRWIADGHHLGYGNLGTPTGQRMFVLGFTHYHIIDGKIVDEWVVYDEMAMLTQIKLGQMALAA